MVAFETHHVIVRTYFQRLQSEFFRRITNITKMSDMGKGLRNNRNIWRLVTFTCKGKGHPITGHEGPEGEQMYSCTLPSTSAVAGYGWSTPRPDRFTPGERAGTHRIVGWVGPRAGLDGCGKSRLPPGFDPRTVQHVASRYTVWRVRISTSNSDPSPKKLAVKYAKSPVQKINSMAPSPIWQAPSTKLKPVALRYEL